MSNDPGTRRDPTAKGAAEGPQEAKQTLAEGAEQVKGEAARATHELRRQGEEIAATATEQADRYASEQKEAGAKHVENFARAVERAADELESSSPELARYAHSAASSVNRFSESLRQRNVRELIDDANDFARREPALFFGVAVMAGMAISRFLRSHDDHQTVERHPHDAGPTSGATTAGRHI